jgi:esterase
MSPSEMVEDLLHFITEQHIPAPFYLFGHSLGGMLAMHLATRYPHLVKGVIIEDIEPVNYLELPPHQSGAHDYYDQIKKMVKLDLSKHRTFNDIRQDLLRNVTHNNLVLANFVLKNIAMVELPTGQTSFQWKVNIDAIAKSYPSFHAEKYVGKFEGPVLAIRGATSRYINLATVKYTFHRIFPNFEESRDVITIPQAGHWVHLHKPKEMVLSIHAFLTKTQGTL